MIREKTNRNLISPNFLLGGTKNIETANQELVDTTSAVFF